MQKIDNAARPGLQFHGWDIVGIAVGCTIEQRHLLFDRLRLILRLLEQLGEFFTTHQLHLRALVEVAGEFCECGEIAILSEFQL